jgi:hypothetical protein
MNKKHFLLVFMVLFLCSHVDETAIRPVITLVDGQGFISTIVKQKTFFKMQDATLCKRAV